MCYSRLEDTATITDMHGHVTTFLEPWLGETVTIKINGFLKIASFSDGFGVCVTDAGACIFL